VAPVPLPDLKAKGIICPKPSEDGWKLLQLQPLRKALLRPRRSLKLNWTSNFEAYLVKIRL
jgi:hypothetical protein